jgi:hypothetical protein
MFGLFTSRCQICENVLKRASYRWQLHGRSAVVCPACNSKLEKKASSAAFGRDVEIPEVKTPKESSGILVGLTLLITLVITLVLVGNKPEQAVNKQTVPVANKPVSVPTSTRTWTSADGRTLQGRITAIDRIAKTVTIVTAEGNEFRDYPIARLSTEDRRLI